LQVVYNTEMAVNVLTETAVSIDPSKAPYLQHILVPPAMKLLLEGDDPQAAAEAALKLYEVKAVKSKPKAPRAEEGAKGEGQGEGEGVGVGGGKGEEKNSSNAKGSGKQGKAAAAAAAAPKGGKGGSSKATSSAAAAAAGGAAGEGGSSKGRGSTAGGGGAAAAAGGGAGGGDEVVVYRRYRLLAVATEQFEDPDNSLASAVMMTCRAYNAELRAVRTKGCGVGDGGAENQPLTSALIYVCGEGVGDREAWLQPLTSALIYVCLSGAYGVGGGGGGERGSSHWEDL